MKKKTKWNYALLIFLLLLCFSQHSRAFMNSLEKKEKPERIIRIGCSADCMPFHFLNKENQINGLSIELVNQIMQRLNLKYEISVALEADLKEQFDMKKLDALLDMSVNKISKENYLYSVPLSYGYSSFYALKESSINSISNLEGKKIALSNKAKEWFSPAYFKLKRVSLLYANSLYSIRLLLSKHVDAVFLDREIMHSLKKNYDLSSQIQMVPSNYNVHPNRILLHQKDTLLLEKINEAIYMMQKEGDFRKSQKKWLYYFSDEQYDKVLIAMLFLTLVTLLVLLAIVLYYREKAIKMSKDDQRMNLIFSKMLDAMPLPVVIKKVGISYSEVIYFNKVAENFFTTQWLLSDGQDYMDRNEYNSKHYSEWNVIETGQISINKEEYTFPNKKKKIMQVTRSIYYEEKEKHVAGIYFDITELEQARKKSELSDQMKSAFLANISHDIRTPLNAIAGFSELLAETENLEERLEYMDIIEINKDLLLTLINEIVNLSQLKTNFMPMYKVWVDVEQLLNSVSKMFVRRLKDKSVDLKIEMNYESLKIYIDPDRMLQIAMNIVGNAVKYTLKGTIRIGAFIAYDSFYFFVQDTGIGISDEKKDKVFVRFEKLDNVAKGTGLGMAICQAIAEKTNGKIDFVSQEGEGSIFWFTLPLKYKTTPKIKPNKQVEIIKQQILTRTWGDETEGY